MMAARAPKRHFRGDRKALIFTLGPRRRSRLGAVELETGAPVSAPADSGPYGIAKSQHRYLEPQAGKEGELRFHLAAAIGKVGRANAECRPIVKRGITVERDFSSRLAVRARLRPGRSANPAEPAIVTGHCARLAADETSRRLRRR